MIISLSLHVKFFLGGRVLVTCTMGVQPTVRDMKLHLGKTDLYNRNLL